MFKYSIYSKLILFAIFVGMSGCAELKELRTLNGQQEITIRDQAEELSKYKKQLSPMTDELKEHERKNMSIFKTKDFESQFNRTLGKVSVNFAEVGECFAIAKRIKDGDLDSWHREWFQFAKELHAQADLCTAKGHTVSARNLYFRASEYYRQASFFFRTDLDCDKLQTAYELQRKTTRAGLDLTDYSCRPVAIPFEGKYLFGYALLQNASGKPRPTIIAPSGYDANAEEMVPYIALPALERGYNVLVFDGPGQGGTLYDKENRLFMRTDFEVPLKATMDFVLSHPAFKHDQIALYGVSFAGFLAPRGATEEHRIAALIADPGQHNIGAAIQAMLPEQLLAILHKESAESDAAFNKLTSTLDGKLLFEPRMTAHGVKSVREYIITLMDYQITPEQAAKINCPSLICDNETDVVSTGQGAELAKMLTSPCDFIRFTSAEGAEGHTETTGRQIFYQKAFDWLDTLFGVSK